VARKRKNNSGQKSGFFAGTGRFFLAVIVIYSIGFGMFKIYQWATTPKAEYRAEEVEVDGLNVIERAEVLRVCGFSSENTAVPVDAEKVYKKLMENPLVKGVSITYRPPQILNITIVEREPVAFIHGKGLNLIDEEGYLIPVPSKNIAWDLPLIARVTENLGRLGARCESPQALELLQVIRRIGTDYPMLQGMISEIRYSGRDRATLVLIRGGAQVHFSTAEAGRQLHVLQNYITRYMDWAELDKIEYIDLRFKNQLIVKPLT
jgi:cell division septal protein FtsQ